VEARNTAFFGKILFTGPVIKDGPAVDYITFEETWRRFKALGPIGIIYTNPNVGPYLRVETHLKNFLF
jgi:hypothetical protein